MNPGRRLDDYAPAPVIFRRLGVAAVLVSVCAAGLWLASAGVLAARILWFS